MDPSAPPPAAPSARKPRRCRADYRWTAPKVIAFLEALSRSGRVADAARAVGMSRQAAYKLRARLDGPKIRAAWEGARKTGVCARAAASLERARSPWEGPGLAALDHWRAGRAQGAQGDNLPSQGDTAATQGDASRAQGDAAAPQGDAISRKATKDRLDTVTSVTGRPWPPRSLR